MPKLSVLSGTDVVKALTGTGFFIDHQTGSHIIMRHEGKLVRTLSVPKHRELKLGTHRGIIKLADMTVEEFIKLL